MMLRAGMSLPALKQILGHREIGMTLGYFEVSQTDLQREYHQAREKMGDIHAPPKLADTTGELSGGLRGICRGLDEDRSQNPLPAQTHCQTPRNLSDFAGGLKKVRINRLFGFQ
jgi:hypothetical protein